MSLSVNTIIAKLTNHFQQTRLLTPLTDKHYSHDSEDDLCSGFQMSLCKMSHFQNYLHSNDHKKWTRILFILTGMIIYLILMYYESLVILY